MKGLAEMVKHICGIQIYITTVIIGFLLFNFVKLLMPK